MTKLEVKKICTQVYKSHCIIKYLYKNYSKRKLYKHIIYKYNFWLHKKERLKHIAYKFFIVSLILL